MWCYFVFDYYDVRITCCMWSYFILDNVDIPHTVNHGVAGCCVMIRTSRAPFGAKAVLCSEAQIRLPKHRGPQHVQEA